MKVVLWGGIHLKTPESTKNFTLWGGFLVSDIALYIPPPAPVTAILGFTEMGLRKAGIYHKIVKSEIEMGLSERNIRTGLVRV